MTSVARRPSSAYNIALIRWLWQKTKALWQLAKNERATPKEIGWAVGLGVFVGSTPALGFHGGLALLVATIFRKNRLFTWIGSRTSNAFFLPFVALVEVQLAHRVRTGEWATLEVKHALQQAPALLLDWCLGTIPVGCVLGSLFGLLAWRLAVRRDRRRETLRVAEGAGTIP